MFAKLLKYEWKATASTLGILSAAAVVVGLAGGVIARGMMDAIFALSEGSTGETLTLAGLVIAIVAVVFSLTAYGLFAELMLLYRFYKNKFTDEGYLTFTLPVTAGKLFLSALVNAFIWMTIVNIILISGIVFIFGMILTSEVLKEYGILSAMREAVSRVLVQYGLYDSVRSEVTTVSFIVLTRLALSPLYGMVIPMTSVVLGAVIAKKHKLLAAFGVYYGLNTLIGLLSGLLNSIVAVLQYFTAGDISAYSGNVAQIILQVAFAIGGYFLSVYLMRRKLNLP